MKLDQALSLMLDPGQILQAQGLSPDPWQREFLLSTDRQVLLNCCRQSGKSTTTAALAIHTALFRAPALVLVLSPGLRQSGELFRKIKDAYNAIGRPAGVMVENQTTLELACGSRIVCLPGKEGTVRSYSKVKLLLVDEASRVPDDLYRAVRPMLAVSNGRLVALSTPFGQRGWFFREWQHGQAFRKVRITWRECPRISAAFIERERKSLGDAWVGQEYECQFGALEGLVYPDFETCVVDDPVVPPGRGVGGIDFGWRNPFAAVWGVHDRDDVLWITAERYSRETPLHEHAAALKEQRGITWYADPSGATEIAELRAAGLKVLRGDNDIRLGIAAVTARLRTKRLVVSRPRCPSLIDEAGLYRYPATSERAALGEKPIDEHNHALGALRYLVSCLDARFIARLRKLAGSRADRAQGPIEEEPAHQDAEQVCKERERERRDLWSNPDVWESWA
jgi:hypothetical protein